MPAIVMPPHLMQRPAHAGAQALLKTSRSSPFTSAPGALEPMLPSRTIADAAVKADASRPAPIAVVVKPEPTVRVIVPPMVLEAMSLGQEVPALEPALKAMSAAAAATAQAQTTTDPEIKVPTDVDTAPLTPDPLSALLSGLGAPVKALGPVPAAPGAVRGSDPAKKASSSGPRAQIDVLKALETKASSSGPRVQADVQKALEAKAPVVVPLPELAPPPVPALPVRRMSLEQVAMTENVSVASDLAEAGAETLSDEEADALMVLPRSKPTALIAAAALAILTTVFAVGIRAGTAHKPAGPLVVPAPRISAPLKMEPAPVVKVASDDDDVLMPLPIKAKALVRTRKAPAPVRTSAEPQHEPSAAGDDFAPPPDTSGDSLKRPAL
jgi:hypothetical protein